MEFSHVVHRGFNEIPCPEIVAAAFEGNKGLVARLLKEGVDPNASDAHGNSVLAWAVSSVHDDIAHMLLAAGADVDRSSGPLGDALTISMRQGPPDRFEIYLAHSRQFVVDGPRTQSAFVGLIRQKNTAMLKHLLKKGTPANSKDEKGFSALHQALNSCDEEMSTALISAGADVNELDTGGESPLRVATFRYPALNKNIRTILRSRGAKFLPRLSLGERLRILIS